MRRKVFFLILFLSLMTGCGGRESLSPTPFPTTGPTSTPPVGGPIALTVTELMAAPGLYRDAVVQLIGQLRKKPVIVCDSELYSSPASWGLGEEGLVAAAGGFDDQVRSLLPGDLTMTVEGRWRRWEGTVGCGKQAQRQEVWYLAVDRILSPSPLAQITLTPSSGVEISAITAEPSVSDPGAAEGGGIFETPSLEETPAPVEPTPFPEDFPEETVTPFEGDPNIFPTSPPVDQTPEAGQTLTSTLPSGTTTPSAVGSETPDISQTPDGTSTVASSGSFVDKGNIYQVLTDSFTTDTVEAGTIDRWSIDLFEGEDLYLYAVAPAPADIILSIYKDGQPLVNRQNNASAGAPEFIDAPQLQGAGIYHIHVEVADGGGAEYGLVVHNDPEYPVSIGGIITPGSPRNSVGLPVGGTHFWFFTGVAGDVVAIRLRAIGNLDPAADLYGPGPVYINSIDDGYQGEEEYRQIPLTATGLHAIRLFEYTLSEPMTYDLDISFQ